MASILEATKKAQLKMQKRKENVVTTIKNNDPFTSGIHKRQYSNTTQANKAPSIYAINKQKKVGMEYVMSMCDYTRQSNDTVTSLTLSGKLITDEGFRLVCTYIKYGYYPHVTTMDLEDNVLTDVSLNYISEIIESGMCPELSTIHLGLNYFNYSSCCLFQDFCRSYSIIVTDGGIPNFAYASQFPQTQPPVLIYRVLTRMDYNNTNRNEVIHYSDFVTMGSWCSDNQEPIVGVQLFYYGKGNITVQLVNSDGQTCCGNGECGDIIMSDQMWPAVNINFGFKNIPFSVVGTFNSTDNYVTAIKINLVALASYLC